MYPNNWKLNILVQRMLKKSILFIFFQFCRKCEYVFICILISSYPSVAQNSLKLILFLIYNFMNLVFLLPGRAKLCIMKIMLSVFLYIHSIGSGKKYKLNEILAWPVFSMRRALTFWWFRDSISLIFFFLDQGLKHTLTWIHQKSGTFLLVAGSGLSMRRALTSWRCTSRRRTPPSGTTSPVTTISPPTSPSR